MKVFHAKVEKLIAIAIALSFFAMVVPISSASSDKSTMACCVGKAAGHCDSGLAPKKIPQHTSEPMCGMDNSEFEDDGITIVAEPTHDESHAAPSSSTHPAAEPLSISQPCQMDCGACATGSSRQQKRERGVVQLTSYQHTSPTTPSRFENLPTFFSSDGYWEQTSPRGPPAELF